MTFSEQERNELLAAEQAARREAEAAHARLTYLTYASDILTTSLERAEVLQSVADLAVPQLADWCVVYLHEPGVLRRVAASHADPEKADLAQRLLETRPLSTDAATPTAEAFRIGHTVLMGDFSDSSTVPSPGYSDDYLKLASELGGAWVMAVPLRTRGRTWGLLSLVTASSDAFDASDVALAEELARRAATAIENASLYEREHTVATALQRSFLPERLPDIPGVDIAARYVPADATMEAGGDWYDAFTLTDGRLALVVGDVAGHGPRAASVMGQLRNGLRAYAIEGHPPAVVMGHLDHLLAFTVDDVYATAVLVVVDPATGALTWANAGHPPPLLVAEGDVRFLSGAADLLLGGAADGYTEHHDVMPTDADLWLYSDGLVEARGEALEVGLDRLAASAAPGRTMPLDEAADRALEDVTASGRRDDDVCILAVRRLPGAAATTTA